MDVALVFARYGPYHVARLKGTLAAAAGRGWGVHGLEVMHLDCEYAWAPVEFEPGLPITTVLGDRQKRATPRNARRLLSQVLDRLDPACVAIPGYADGPALAALAWCRVRDRAAVLMSESKGNDAQRWLPVEVFKRILIGLYDAALVGGCAQATYLRELGIGGERVFVGYDTVDNRHFERGADAARTQQETWRRKLGVPRPFVLASSRFLRRKNVPRLIESYGAYRATVGSRQAWDLVILGGGADRARIERTVRDLGLSDCVHLPGFRQFGELPVWYGLANVFVHVPLRDPWGLVVNEAMASAVPVVVSSAAGASELVRDGVDGWVVDPRNTDRIVRSLVGAHEAGVEALRSMGSNARETVRAWGPERFGQGLMAAAEVGLRHRATRGGASRLAGRLLALLLTLPHARRR
jgi:1,2-diacylglycerol 3-alpha-glucosyltransferase